MTDAAKAVFIILAAGSSSRLGRPKQFLNYDGVTLIKHAVKTAYQLNPLAVIVVSGFLHDELIAELEEVAADIVYNPIWQQGMGSSIISGIKHFQKSVYKNEATSLVIMLSDQPLITPAHLHNLIIAIEGNTSTFISATSYQGTIGVPAAFNVSFLPKLMQLPPQKGAQVLFKNYSEYLITIEFEKAAIDIDTEQDYQRLLKRQQS